MPNTVQIKRSAVSGKVPLVTDLQLGELAVNTFDGKLFLKKNNGTESIVELGSASGTTSVANGGTGRATLTANNLLVGNGTNAVNFVAPGNYQNVLFSSGSGWFSGPLFSAENIWSAKQIFGNIYNVGAKFRHASEFININSSTALGTNATETMYVSAGATTLYQTNPIEDWALSLNFDPSFDFNSRIAYGEAFTCVALVTQGATARKITSVLVEGTASGVSVKWQGGSPPSAGNANSIDCYTFTIIKTGEYQFTVLASLTKFA